MTGRLFGSVQSASCAITLPAEARRMTWLPKCAALSGAVALKVTLRLLLMIDTLSAAPERR